MVTNSKSPTVIDLILLSLFIIFITAQPFFLHHEIIMMETGIHLPGIQALFRGAIPYKDFLYLRGPLELYMPAFLMKLFGENMILLPIFYYGGTILTLLLGILLAFQLYRTRVVLYLMTLVFVARTFPRISFYYWGGMRPQDITTSNPTDSLLTFSLLNIGKEKVNNKISSNSLNLKERA